MTVSRRTPWLLVLLAAVAVTAALGVAALRVRPHASLVDLLPDGSDAAADYRRFLETFGGFERVFVLVEGPPAATTDELSAATAAVADRLRGSPLLQDVRAGVEPADLEFFERWVLPRRPLLEPVDRERVVAALGRDAIRRRVTELRSRILAPTSSFERPLLRADPLGLAAGRGWPDAAEDLPVDPATGAFVVADPPTGLVVATAAVGEIDVAAGRRLVEQLDGARAMVQAEQGDGWSIRAVGGPLYAAHDEELIRSDLARTVTGSLAGCVIVLLLAFGGWRIPVVAAATVATGLVWTAGAIGLAGGRVSAMSLGFAAVLVGLGVDYAIHAGARFRGELLAGRDRSAAVQAVVRRAGAGIAASAATTAAAFGILSAAHFRPLREVGAVVAGGIIAMVLATAAVALAALAVAGPTRERAGLVWRGLADAVDTVVALAVRRPVPVLAVAAILTAASVPGLLRLRLDADPRAIRPTDHPTTATEAALAERFGIGSETVTIVVSGPDEGAALRAAARVVDALREALPETASFRSPSQWLVDGTTAHRRAQRLAELPIGTAADVLEDELRRAGLDPAGFAPGLSALRSMAAGRDPGAPPPHARPDWLDAMLRHGDGAVHAAIRVRLAPGTWPDGPPPAVLDRIRRTAPGAAVASATRLGSELRTLAVGDLRRLGGLALVTVVGVVALSFRLRIVPTALATAPVLLGTAWSLGAWGAAGRPLDLVSLAVLPILLGIGIDDGLHAVHGAGRGTPDRAFREAGLAMSLTTLTTCVGFGTLAMSHLPGLRHAALLVPLGVAACLAATLLVVPAAAALLLHWRR